MTKRATFHLIDEAGNTVATYSRKWEAEQAARPGQRVVKQ